MSAPLDAAPTVASLPSDDEGDAYAVQFGPFTGPLRATRHAAEADCDALTAALLPSLAIARRAGDLRADPDLLDQLTRYSLGPRGGALAVLRWVIDGAGVGPDDGPTLDRLGGEMAVVADGSGE